MIGSEDRAATTDGRAHVILDLILIDGIPRDIHGEDVSLLAAISCCDFEALRSAKRVHLVERLADQSGSVLAAHAFHLIDTGLGQGGRSFSLL